MSKQRPHYINFFGVPASGKSTIKRELCRTLAADGIRIDLPEKGHDVAATIAFAATHPNAYFATIAQWHRYSRAKKERAFGKRQILRSASYFYRSSAAFFFDEGFLHKEVNEHNSASHVEELLRFLPDSEKTFVFVETSAERAHERAKTRSTTKRVISLDDYQRYCRNNSDFFFSLKEKEGQNGVAQVIKLNGENPVGENVAELISILTPRLPR
ncbi:MAG: hypothetical protein EA403_01065 [Spirochaetaceae bacterium]|nr:MAG: hypothetical protein EA403_01065 [Spirochaetaceae bacterium]